MKKLMKQVLIGAITIAFLSTTSLIAQDWSKEQQEVWKGIENSWTKWQETDYDEAFTDIHDNYLGWNNEDPLPTSKTKWINAMNKYKDMLSQKEFDIEPARIMVYKDVAVVHYYYEYAFLYTMGEDKKFVSKKGKNTEFFIKEDGKWMLIGDMSYSHSKK